MNCTNNVSCGCGLNHGVADDYNYGRGGQWFMVLIGNKNANYLFRVLAEDQYMAKDLAIAQYSRDPLAKNILETEVFTSQEIREIRQPAPQERHDCNG